MQATIQNTLYIYRERERERDGRVSEKNLKDFGILVTSPRHTPASYPLSCFSSRLLSHPFVRCFVTPFCHPLRHTFVIPSRHTLLSFLLHVYVIPFKSLSSGFAGRVLLMLLCVARSPLFPLRGYV